MAVADRGLVVELDKSFGSERADCFKQDDPWLAVSRLGDVEQARVGQVEDKVQGVGRDVVRKTDRTDRVEIGAANEDAEMGQELLFLGAQEVV